MGKILFVMPRLPFPATSGRKTSLYNYCKILKKLGYELIVVSFLEDGDNPSKKPDFIDKIVVLPKVSGKEKIKNLIMKTLLARKYPLQVSLYWSNDSKKIIQHLISTERPDIIIADMVRTTEYIKSADCFKIADLDDMLSLRYKRQLEVDLNGVNPYGAYLKSLPKLVQKFLMNNEIKKLVLKSEIALLEKYELQMGKDCDAVVFVAQRESEIFNRKLGQNKAFTIPIGVDIEYFSKRIPNGSIDMNKIAFLGALDVAHNENAVIHFVELILPKILKTNPYVQFIVIGGGVTNRLKQYASSNVIFTDRVEDVRDYIEQCRVFVCPLNFGTGIKTKNLEAMAMGVPIVTSPIGAENISAIDGEDWIIAKSDEDFADAVLKVLKDDILYEKLSTNGRCFIVNNYTWDKVQADFAELLTINQ